MAMMQPESRASKKFPSVTGLAGWQVNLKTQAVVPAPAPARSKLDGVDKSRTLRSADVGAPPTSLSAPSLCICSEREYQDFEPVLDLRQRHGAEPRQLSAQEARQLAPALEVTDVHRAVLFPSGAHLAVPPAELRQRLLDTFTGKFHHHTQWQQNDKSHALGCATRRVCVRAGRASLPPAPREGNCLELVSE